MKPPISKADLLSQASQCVKCGLCLPHCPTYQATQDENESPRGRITLMQGLLSDQLPASSKAQAHLDKCLTCRHCEAACPANVPYGDLIEQTRTFYPPQDTIALKGMKFLVKHPKLRRQVAYLLYGLQISGLRQLGEKIGLIRGLGLSRLNELLPKMLRPASFKTNYPAKALSQGKVGLFLGCLAPEFDPKTLQDAQSVLSQLGFQVVVPKQQGCCGALWQHSGDEKTADRCQQNNQTAFADDDLAAILYTASGCGATLVASAHATLANRATELSQFILAYLPESLKRIEETVLLHTPCTLKNACHQDEAPAALLAKIPGLNLIKYRSHGQCCGSAGANMLTQAGIADQLVEPLIETIKSTKATYLATSNIGCALHIQRHLNKAQLTHVKIRHPISILKQALNN